MDQQPCIVTIIFLLCAESTSSYFTEKTYRLPLIVCTNFSDFSESNQKTRYDTSLIINNNQRGNLAGKNTIKYTLNRSCLSMINLVRTSNLHIE